MIVSYHTVFFRPIKNNKPDYTRDVCVLHLQEIKTIYVNFVLNCYVVVWNNDKLTYYNRKYWYYEVCVNYLPYIEKKLGIKGLCER